MNALKLNKEQIKRHGEKGQTTVGLIADFPAFEMNYERTRLSYWWVCMEGEVLDDIWCGKVSLCYVFLSLYPSEGAKEAWVDDCGFRRGTMFIETLFLIRTLLFYCVEIGEIFFKKLMGKSVDSNKEDELV